MPTRFLITPPIIQAAPWYLGALFFTFQIYGDFSGYSDIAIGTSDFLGLT